MIGKNPPTVCASIAAGGSAGVVWWLLGYFEYPFAETNAHYELEALSDAGFYDLNLTVSINTYYLGDLDLST